jgi:hypothetical protein
LKGRWASCNRLQPARQLTHRTGEADGVHQEPVGFLLAIMNDAAVDTGLRIEAAKALLPYFRKALD